MATKSRSVLLTEYNKWELITVLKDAKARIDETILSHEEAFAKWKIEAPDKFANFVEDMNIDNIRWTDTRLSDFAPPRKSQACSDYRIQNLNREIARVGLVQGDTIRLRADDNIWTYIGLGECL